ncbi:GNAT family N-acetyltransferase [Micromonospora sp. DT233]|uniref:GNAT family N-acetyltransferase n=1 Tax=Micromonospora sp. DT233 TaxID=3393432 RepID=UPI003CFAA104
MYARALTADAELRPLDPGRAEEFLRNLDRCRDHISPWVGASFVAVDLPSAREVLRRYAERWARDGGGLWGIWLDATLVGGVMFVSFDVVSGSCEVGCWVEPTAQGRGLVTRAVGLIVDWAVRGRGIHRVEWRTNADNARSIAVARRLGMRLDGTLRQVYRGPGERMDLQIWSVLAPEWRNPAPTGERVAVGGDATGPVGEPAPTTGGPGEDDG